MTANCPGCTTTSLTSSSASCVRSVPRATKAFVPLRRTGTVEEIANLVFRKDGKTVANPRRPRILDLDELPFPAYEKLSGFPEGYHLPLFSYEKRRRRQRRSPVAPPDDVGLCRVPATIHADSQKRRLLKSGANKHQAVPKYRPRHVGKSITVKHMPDFLARARLICDNPEGASAYQLVSACEMHYQRRRISMTCFSVLFPSNAAGPFVQCHHILDRHAITVHDQQIFFERLGVASSCRAPLQCRP